METGPVCSRVSKHDQLTHKVAPSLSQLRADLIGALSACDALEQGLHSATSYNDARRRLRARTIVLRDSIDEFRRNSNEPYNFWDDVAKR